MKRRHQIERSFFATEPSAYLMENMKIHGDIEPFDDQSRNAMTFEWRMAMRSTSALGIKKCSFCRREREVCRSFFYQIMNLY